MHRGAAWPSTIDVSACLLRVAWQADQRTAGLPPTQMAGCLACPRRLASPSARLSTLTLASERRLAIGAGVCFNQVRRKDRSFRFLCPASMNRNCPSTPGTIGRFRTRQLQKSPQAAVKRRWRYGRNNARKPIFGRLCHDARRNVQHDREPIIHRPVDRRQRFEDFFAGCPKAGTHPRVGSLCWRGRSLQSHSRSPQPRF